MFRLHFWPRTGWLNDPNGLVFHNGVHHLFFQANPGELRWGRIQWGHATSTDLVHWTQHDAALHPGDDPTDADVFGCWSGCAVLDPADPSGEVTFLYTGARRDGDVVVQTCCAASGSGDLATLVRDEANPIVQAPPVGQVTAFRDHTVIPDTDLGSDDGAGWRMLIGGQIDGQSAVFGYRTPEAARGLPAPQALRQWEYTGVALSGPESDLPGEVWECPELFRIRDEVASADSDVLIISRLDETGPNPPERPLVHWSSGRFEGGKFAPQQYGMVDHGGAFYAPQSYWLPSGERIMFGWLRTHLDPVYGLHDAFDPEVPAPHNEPDHGRPSVGVMSLPRQIIVREGRMMSVPAPHLDTARMRSTTCEWAAGEPLEIASSQWADAAACEVVIPAGVRVAAVTCLYPDGSQWSVNLAALHDAAGGDGVRGGGARSHASDLPTRIFFDGGLLECFAQGEAMSLSNLSHTTLAAMLLETDTGAAPEAPATVEVHGY